VAVRRRSNKQLSSQFRFQRGLAGISAAAFKPRLELEQRNCVRSCRIDIYSQILDSVIADHFRFEDLFQPSGGLQHADRVDRNRVPEL